MVRILREKSAGPTWVKIGQVRTLSVDRIGHALGRSTPEEMERMIEGLYEFIGP